MKAEPEPVSLDEVADLSADVRTWLEVHRASGALNPTTPAPQSVARAARAHAEASTTKSRGGSSFAGASAGGRVQPPRLSGGDAVDRHRPTPTPDSPAGSAQDRRATPALHSVSLAAVQEELGECRRCGLCQTRTNIVFGAGSENADIVFVGEGPSDQDDQQGEPFVGEAGELLTRIINNVLRLERSDVYICNVIKCRPPDKRRPEPEEVAACSPFLRKQLGVLQPKVVVALGRFALQALLGTAQPVGHSRGTAHPFGSAVLVPTEDPAYLLRNPADKRKTMQDMMLVRAEYERATGMSLKPVLRRQR